MKKLVAILLAVLMTVSLAACATQAADTEKKTEEENTQIANPFTDCETLEDAEKICGFGMTVPEKIDGYDEILIQAIDDYMVQVIYTKDEDNEVLVRKAKDSGDISGDYNEYESVKTAEIDGKDVVFKGHADGEINNAVWSNGEYSYSIYISGAGFSVDTVTELVNATV